MRHDVSRPRAILAMAATLAVCAPFARFACWIEKRGNPRRMRMHCTSMTIEIALP
jgi:hypothetical protein